MTMRGFGQLHNRRDQRGNPLIRFFPHGDPLFVHFRETPMGLSKLGRIPLLLLSSLRQNLLDGWDPCIVFGRTLNQKLNRLLDIHAH